MIENTFGVKFAFNVNAHLLWLRFLDLWNCFNGNWNYLSGRPVWYLNCEVRRTRLWLPTSAANFDRQRSLPLCLSCAPKSIFLDTFPKRRVTFSSTRTPTQWGERVSNGKEKRTRSVWVVPFWGGRCQIWRKREATSVLTSLNVGICASAALARQRWRGSAGAAAPPVWCSRPRIQSSVVSGGATERSGTAGRKIPRHPLENVFISSVMTQSRQNSRV